MYFPCYSSQEQLVSYTGVLDKVALMVYFFFFDLILVLGFIGYFAVFFYIRTSLSLTRLLATPVTWIR